MKNGRSLMELAQELERQRNAKRDYLLDTRNLEMGFVEAGAYQMMMRNDSKNISTLLGVGEIAHRQIGSALGIPAKYYDKMRAENPELLAQNVNSWFTMTPQKRMVRTLDGNARAFLSERYRRIDNAEIAEAVLPILAEMPDVRIESCEITESKMYLKAVNPRLTAEVVPGDIVQSGILITNSEVGMGSMSIQPLVYRLVCTNGMVVNDARTRKYHVGRGNEAGEDYTLYSSETLAADDRALLLKVRDTVRAVVDHFTILDNLSLSNEQLRTELAKYDQSSIWFQSDIQGLRTSARGRIYDSYVRDQVAVGREWIAGKRFIEMAVGVDVGGTDATCATLTGITSGWRDVVHIDGLYHKQGISEKMTEARYARAIAEWLKPWTRIYPQIANVYVDSAAKLFRAALREELSKQGMGRIAVIGTDKSDGIRARIELVCMLLMQGRYHVAEHLAPWHEALQMATWDEAAYEKGEWMRLDNGSYPVDALDSSEYSIYPYAGYLATVG